MIASDVLTFALLILDFSVVSMPADINHLIIADTFPLLSLSY